MTGSGAVVDGPRRCSRANVTRSRCFGTGRVHGARPRRQRFAVSSAPFEVAGSAADRRTGPRLGRVIRCVDILITDDAQLPPRNVVLDSASSALNGQRSRSAHPPR
jgi:hypothetical protein